jgi:hypothetical protein
MIHNKSNNFKERKHEWTVEMMAARAARENELKRI